MARAATIARRAAAGLAIAAAVFAVPEIWGRPWSIRHFYLRTLLEQVWHSPQLCSSMHLLDFRKDQLDDASPAALEQMRAMVAKQLETLHSYDRAALSPEEQDSYDVMDWFLRNEVPPDTNGPVASAATPYLINQLGGEHTAFPDFMLNHHELSSRGDAEAYVARLRAAGTKIDQVITSARADAAKGVVAPKFILDKVEADTRDFAAKPASENALVTHLAKKLEAMKDVDAAARTDLVARATKAVEEIVKPAWVRYADAVALLEKEATDDGLWHQPGGDARYGFFLRLGTSSDLSADAVHTLGVSEVARIEAELHAVLITLGKDGPSPTDAVRALEQEPRFQYADTQEGRDQFIADYQKIEDEVLARPELFIATPFTVPVKVEPLPSFLEGSWAAGRYEAPPLDESRPGVFHVNLGRSRNKIEMRTLGYHEGMPGHHLQVVYARHLKQLPMFRQLVPFNAYYEGWALWAEQLAATQGFQNDPYDRLGFLSAQLLRAARLVVDTGIHSKRWSRAEAVAYFRAHTIAPDKDIGIEIDRYFVTPGQACGYMVGKKTIERLADKARATLGPKFSLPAFDDVVLQSGAVPMPVLESVVDRWLAAQTVARN
jgi:uncharacterized protein (DUF885 family)